MLLASGKCNVKCVVGSELSVSCKARIRLLVDLRDIFSDLGSGWWAEKTLKMTSFGLQCVIVVFPKHTHVFGVICTLRHDNTGETF